MAAAWPNSLRLVVASCLSAAVARAVGLGHVGAQLGVVALLGVQAPGLRQQQAQQHQAGGLQGVALDDGDHVSPSPHLTASSARRLARPWRNV